MALQVFGTKKCKDTQKAERWFKERDLRYQFVDLAEKGISPGELRAVSDAVGKETLLDRESPRYAKRGLAWMEHDPEEEALADPLLLRTPIVRDGRKAVMGFDPEGWKRISDL
ncbi:MAG TPA: ArsC/Spx/MgsR family protein [Spirochaetales bacterium]|nr:ArsC/Spx/MgsR family protein [Spirochaetales bacterium]